MPTTSGDGVNPLRIFISSVQREFAEERAVLRDYVRDDVLIRRFFDVFLFEDTPAADRRPDHVYLDEVGRSHIYLGLFGSDYGNEDDEGVSPTEREFEHATSVGTHRLIFVKEERDDTRHPKMRKLIRKAQSGLIRKRFNTTAELVTGLYAALVEYLENKELIRWGPFDAAPCGNATLDAPSSSVPAGRGHAASETFGASEPAERGPADERCGVVVREGTATIPDFF